MSINIPLKPHMVTELVPVFYTPRRQQLCNVLLLTRAVSCSLHSHDAGRWDYHLDVIFSGPSFPSLNGFSKSCMEMKLNRRDVLNG